MEFRMTVTTSEFETLISQTEHLKALEAESIFILREAAAEFRARFAPPENRVWGVLWSSESPAYVGGGTPALHRDGVLHVAGESALVLAPGPLTPDAAPELRSDKPTAKHSDKATGGNHGA